MANTYSSEKHKFSIGDIVRVSQSVKEGDKDKIQVFEGRVIAIKGKSPNMTFMVRRIGADNIGVEKIYPISSPTITKIEIKKSIKEKRAKLYFLRKQK